MKRSIAERYGPALVLFACVAAFLGYFIRQGLVDAGTSLRTSYDFHSYFLPRFVLGSRELFAGNLPVWNRFEYGGLPLLATAQPAALYPPKALLFGLFAPLTALWIYFVLHYVALVGSFLLFARQRGLGPVATITGALVWVFSPPLLLSHFNPVRIANMVWMPLLFVLSERVAKEKGHAVFGGLALVVALQLVAGYPEATIDTALLVALDAIVSYATKRWEDPPWRTLPQIGAAFVLGAVTAGAQMFPLAELAAIAQRENVSNAAYQPGRDLFSTLTSTVPTLAVFIVFGLFIKRARGAMAGFALCMLMGEGGWLLLRRLPGFSMTRFPFVWVFLLVFYFAWLAAESVEGLARGEGISPRARKAGLVIAGVFGLLTVVAFALEAHGFVTGAVHTEFVARYLGSPVAAILGAIGAALLVAAAVLTFRGRSASWAWVAAPAVLTLAHLAGYPYGNVPSPFTRPSKHGQIASLHGDPASIDGRALSLYDLLYGYEITDEIPSPLGVEFSFLPYRYRLLLLRLKFLPTYATIDWDLLLSARGFLDAMDVELITAHPAQIKDLAELGFRPLRRSGVALLLANDARMGHAWVTRGVRRVSGDEAALAAVTGESFDPRRAVLLEGPTRHGYPEADLAEPVRPRAERRQSATDVEFDVELDRPGIFVHSETYYPGWVATVNGRPAPLHVGNYVLRAVELEAGRSTVRFQYRPASVRYGLLSSALGGAVILALFVFPHRRLRRPRTMK